ncbi:MAG TPA: hypothetical protein VGT41_06865 [Candidatus Babeliales bacterium]|nr:hypothetical protein [Candidatus Babeliales bacterium]
MKSLVHCCGKVAWVLTALAAIMVGLYPFGFDLFLTKFMIDTPALALTLRYVCLAAGVLSLAMFAMTCNSNCCASCNK